MTSRNQQEVAGCILLQNRLTNFEFRMSILMSKVSQILAFGAQVSDTHVQQNVFHLAITE